MKSLRLLLNLLVFVFFQNSLAAQNEPTADLNLLAAPASPAATLLGIAPSEVDKPRDPMHFLASVSNATGFFSGLPTNYAIEIAPAWMFRPSRITFDKFCKNTLSESAWQGLTFSAAVSGQDGEVDSLRSRHVSFALKTSLLRGKLSEKTTKQLADAQTKLEKISAEVDALEKTDDELKKLKKALVNGDGNPNDIQAKIDARRKAIHDGYQSELLTEFGESISDLRFTRTGLKLDLAIGTVVDFPGGKFGNSRTSRAGAWLSGGYEGERGWSFLGIARWLTNPDQIYALENGTLDTDDVQTFDAGARLIVAPTDSRFTLSAEAIYRSILAPTDALESNWRFTANAEYKFRKNHSLTFSYGRDFDGTVSRDGNVIALLSLFTGFGSEKSLSGVEKVEVGED